MVQGFHYPFPALAYIEKSGTGYREIPVPWSPTHLIGRLQARRPRLTRPSFLPSRRTGNVAMDKAAKANSANARAPIREDAHD